MILDRLHNDYSQTIPQSRQEGRAACGSSMEGADEMTSARLTRPATWLVVLALVLMTRTVTPASSHAQATHRTSPLVGYWQKTNTCAELVRALTKAGFADRIPDVVGGSGLIKGPENQPLSDPTHPCTKATTPKKHSHLFSSMGQFASYDENGGQVDDGTYTVRNQRTFVMHGDTFKDKVVVHFRVQGKVIRFQVVIPHPCTGACRVKMGWAISAFYPGAPFRRVQSP
jgi:hypothetical protein